MTESRPLEKTRKGAHGGREGIVLVVVMSFLAALLLLGGTVFTVLRLDVNNTEFYSDAVTAFHHADAGAHYVYSRVRLDEQTNGVWLQRAVVPVNYAAPSGFNFDTVTNFVRLADNRSFMYRVTGRARSAEAIIEVVFSFDPSIMVGVFGDELVELGPTTEIKSYRSGDGMTPSSSTGEATVGTNDELKTKTDAIDGAIYLGVDASGNPADYSEEFTTSADVVRVSRMDHDPLGAAGGAVADLFAAVALTNDNALAVGGTIVGNTLTIEGNVTLVAGNYYVDEIDIRSGETLAIDASGGIVQVFLTGQGNCMPNGSIITTDPYPENFQIFSASTDTINFQPNNTFVGGIYAPFARINIQPNGDFIGSLWGREVQIKPNGVMYIDMDFVERFDAGIPVALESWRQVSN